MAVMLHLLVFSCMLLSLTNDYNQNKMKLQLQKKERSRRNYIPYSSTFFPNQNLSLAFLVGNEVLFNPNRTISQLFPVHQTMLKCIRYLLRWKVLRSGYRPRYFLSMDPNGVRKQQIVQLHDDGK